ncbi:Probable RNA-directed DNA polymerase from transposon BS [Eumeta japonica]|uniref:Probable RNA-directed DNA polymerase from transposon BS n=1 Tax=Eumeta variegata TaxID=151549 RepID=A0A4C1VI50_EUMVA|nr:Probable RNA-directed DNA polymerase from transposon BS [Eumeta japonica]
MSNYERTGHTVVGVPLYYRRSYIAVNIPPLTNMEATGCRLAMTGHSTLVIVSVYLPSPKRLLRRDLRALFALGDAVILFDEIDCHRCSYQPRQDSGRGERAGGSASSDRRKFPPDILELIRAKTQLCAARAYPTPEYRSRARALQREVKARVREFRNESWSDLMEEKTIPQSVLGMAIDDAEIAECLADSIETQCSHASLRTTSLISVASRKRFSKTSLEPKDDLAPVSLSEVQTLVKSLNTRKAPGLDGIHKPGTTRPPASYRPISLLSGLGKLSKILKTRLSDHLLGKGLIIDEQFGFRPAILVQQVLRLVEYVSEGFETERSTVAVFFDVAKAFDRQTDISHLGMSALTRQDVLSEQEFLKAPPSLLCCTPHTNDVPRPSSSGVQLALFADDTALFTEIGIGAPDSPSSLQRAIDELGQWFRKWRIEVNPTNQQPYNSSMSGHRPKLPYSTRPPLTASGRAGGREPTRDGFLRHPMPRRLPPGVVHSACHAPSALACAVRPHSVKLSKSSDLSSDSSRPTK